MKETVFDNWQAKVGCFLAAIVLWLLLKETIDPGTLDQILTGTMPNTQATP